MGKCIISTGSVTYALKAQKELSLKNVLSEIVKTDSAKSRRGCTYGVSLNCAEINYAVTLLDGIKMKYEITDSL